MKFRARLRLVIESLLWPPVAVVLVVMGFRPIGKGVRRA